MSDICLIFLAVPLLTPVEVLKCKLAEFPRKPYREGFQLNRSAHARGLEPIVSTLCDEAASLSDTLHRNLLQAHCVVLTRLL